MFNNILLDQIADSLANHGHIVLQDFLPIELAKELMLDARENKQLKFKEAAIGRSFEQQLNVTIRSDTIHWLSAESAPQLQYLKLMEQLRLELNRRLYMGLFDYECHYSHYAPGNIYKRHVDAFRGKSNRVLSTVLYLNPLWSAEEAGELLIFRDKQSSPFLIVPPLLNTCVIFLSEQFPHEVSATRRDRYSIAGWFRLNSSSNKHIDPAT
ncbi:MAG: SM-20-related protein [Paraglaciecola sp.]